MTSLDLANFHDVLGQLPRLKTYTHVLLSFPLHRDDSAASAIAAIQAGTKKLIEGFPWIACRVVHSGSTPDSSGDFSLAHCPELAARNALVRIKDCNELLPSYEELLSNKGPVSKLDGRTLAPVPAFPHVYTEAELNPAPVFVVQINIVKNGLLLDIAAQHNFIDGGGLLRLLELLGRSMRGEAFSSQEIRDGNQDRSKLIPLLRADEATLNHSHLLREPLASVGPPLKVSDATWHFVRFPASKVSALKIRANEDLQGLPDTFVSTNDALSAFIWRRTAAVRFEHGQSPDAYTKFSRALDARRALGISRDYLGQMGYNATCRQKFTELRDQPLGLTALFMRQAVAEVNNEYSVRSWATFVANEPDKSRIMFGGTFNPDTDIGLSSLIHGSVHETEFGVLGKPDLIRRPNFLPLEGCVYLWAHTMDGDVDALLCLKQLDWTGLRKDLEWNEYTEFIG